VPAPTLRSQEIDLAAAKDILARLERYAASVRTAPRDPLSPPAAPAPKHPMAVPTAPPRDDILPVAVPWAYARRPDVRTTEVPQADSHTVETPRRIDPATVDLFPYDLAASIVACALTIMAYISFGRPVAVGVTVVLAVAGECMRRFRWFPSIGVKILIGTLAGLVLVFTA
jgi:hypothetical protein